MESSSHPVTTTENQYGFRLRLTFNHDPMITLHTFTDTPFYTLTLTPPASTEEKFRPLTNEEQRDRRATDFALSINHGAWYI